MGALPLPIKPTSMVGTHPVGSTIVVTRRDKYYNRKGIVIDNTGKKFVHVRLEPIESSEFWRGHPSVVIKKTPNNLKVVHRP